MYSPSRYSSSDWGQYYQGSWLLHEGKAIYVMSTEPSGFVCRTSDQSLIQIPVEDITWQGFPPPRFVSVGDSVYFIGPNGQRSYKKGITRSNITAQLVGFGGEGLQSPSRVTETLVEAYLEASLPPDRECLPIPPRYILEQFLSREAFPPQVILLQDGETCLSCNERRNHFLLYRQGFMVLSGDWDAILTELYDA